MKKLFTTFFMLLLLFSNLSLPGLVYGDNIYGSEINSAKLLETHVVKLKKQLNIFISKYEVSWDALIEESIRKLWVMEKWLKKIKNKKVYGEKASEYISIIVRSLRTINDKLRPYLKQLVILNISEVNKYKTRFNIKIKPFIPKIKNLVIILASNIKSKKKLNDKDRDVIKLLTYINDYIDNLNNFEFKNFSTKNKLKSYLVANIKNIKRDILHIKRIYK